MKLNTLLKTLGFLALAATPVVAGTAPAPKQPAPVAPVNDDLGITASLGYDTNLIWRGLNVGNNWVSGGLRGAIPLVGGAGQDGAGTRLAWDVNYGSLAGDQDHFGGNGGIGNNANASFQRLSLGAAVQHDLGPVTASLGYRYYSNMGFLGRQGGLNDAQEVSFGLATALGPINVASSANYDYVNDSWYFDFDLNTNIAVTDAISIVPFFNVGYGHNMNWQFSNRSVLASVNGPNARGALSGAGNPSFRDDVTGWTAVNTGIRVPVKLNSRATLTPYIAANLPLGTTANIGGEARAVGLPDTPYKGILYGGVSLTVRF